MSNLAERMKADALEAQVFSRKHLVIELDFSVASIEELEANVDTVEFALKGGLSDENVAMLTRIWGAYLGESLCRVCTAEWVEQDGKAVLRGANIETCPQDQISQRLAEGSAHNLADYFRQTKDQL